MAIDQTAKALDIADRGAELADMFLDAVEGLEQILSIAVDCGISMTTYDDDLAESSLKYFDGATFNRLAVAIPNIVTAIDTAGGAGNGTTIRQLMNKLRKNY